MRRQGDTIVFTLAVPSLLLILREFASFTFLGQMPKRRPVVPFSAPADLQWVSYNPKTGIAACAVPFCLAFCLGLFSR
jgi:hypothetical protein